jgi:hypothetical protein
MKKIWFTRMLLMGLLCSSLLVGLALAVDDKAVADVDDKAANDVDNKSVADIDDKVVNDIDDKAVLNVDVSAANNVDDKALGDNNGDNDNGEK